MPRDVSLSDSKCWNGGQKWTLVPICCRHEHRDGDQLQRHREHLPVPRGDEVLEGEAHPAKETGEVFCITINL